MAIFPGITLLRINIPAGVLVNLLGLIELNSPTGIGLVLQIPPLGNSLSSGIGNGLGSGIGNSLGSGIGRIIKSFK